MSRTVIRFELKGETRQLALALQHHVVTNLGMNMDLSAICRNQFVTWMIDNIQRGQTAREGSTADAEYTEATQTETVIDVDSTPSEVASTSNELQAATETGDYP